jgi:hypothetical protein
MLGVTFQSTQVICNSFRSAQSGKDARRCEVRPEVHIYCGLWVAARNYSRSGGNEQCASHLRTSEMPLEHKRRQEEGPEHHELSKNWEDLKSTNHLSDRN